MCENCLSRTKEHLTYYKNLYGFIVGLLLIVGICSLFQKPITNGIVDTVEKIGVDSSNFLHWLAFWGLYMILFLPHPFAMQWLLTAIAGYYWGWTFLVILGVGQLLGVPGAYLLARNLKHCTKYLLKEEDLRDFKMAFNSKPIMMSFLIMFGPAPAQYQILIPTWLDVHWSIVIFFCALGNFLILIPYGALGAQAENIQDAVNSNNPASRLILPAVVLLGVGSLGVIAWQMNRVLEQNKRDEDNGIVDIGLEDRDNDIDL